VTQALDRVRKVAKERKKEQFTALLHHVSVETLRTAFYALKHRSPSCLNSRGESMPAVILGEHHPRLSANRKNERSAAAHDATDTRHQFSRPFDSRNASMSPMVIDAIEALPEEACSRKTSTCHR
jgi:hypothetical protein